MMIVWRFDMLGVFVCIMLPKFNISWLGSKIVNSGRIAGEIGNYCYRIANRKCYESSAEMK